ncbi:MAG: WD40 repeat domain-containing protein, partial [Cyanobacteria bacterium P01_C01_bin.120]
DWVWSVAFSPDGQTLASGSLDETVMLWDVQTQQHLKTLAGHSQFVWSVAWSPTGSVLASGSADRSIKLWDPTTGNCLHTLEGHDHQVTSVAFHPAGNMLASGSDDEAIRLWDVKTGYCLRALDKHTDQMDTADTNKGQIRAVTFSPDGQLVASGGLDRTIRVWEVKTGTCIQTISNHSEPISSLTFNPNGKVLASSGESGIIIHLSAIKTGRLLQELKTDSPYKGMNITDVQGLSQAQKSNLITLGAVSDEMLSE